ncbi:permease-like cell division protein FtsX [Microbispora sp. NPDC046933]|uniref:permease-like cell division protein FtsX n=1 Tax=Microbispora sp. NPDC046933 TaxID=3155618 RepID=UPI0033EAC387
MSTIEDRLRDAMAARARTVRDDGRVLALPAPRRNRPRGLAIAAAALAVAGTIVGVARLAEPSPDPREVSLAVMALSGAAASSDGVDVSVYLCANSSPFENCKGGAATDREKENIERALQARSDVKTIVFEDRRTAFENFRRSETNPRLLKVIRVEDMPESFRLKVAPGADHLAMARAASELPGVSNVVDGGCLRENLNRPAGSSRQCSFRGAGR